MGSRYALLRWLPANRVDGRARPRDTPSWPDEAGRPHQSAQSDSEGLRHRAAATGQQARYALQYGRLSNQVEVWRTATRLPHHSGPGKRRVRKARRLAPQHLPEFSETVGCSIAAARAAAIALRRADDGL